MDGLRSVRRRLSGIRSTLWRLSRARQVRRKCAALDEVRLNVGCGSQPTPGWVNFDMFVSNEVDCWDCGQGLPFADASVRAVYSEHAFEHFDADVAAPAFLAECFRCLKPGGVLRLVVPDAGAYLKAYALGWAELARMRPLTATVAGWEDPWLGHVYETPMQLINAVFRQGGEHKYAYDEETLALALRQAGFRRINRCGFGVSADPEMAPDTASRSGESLYMEAIK